MAAKNAKRGVKRFLEQSTGDRVDQGKFECSHVRSKRLKTMLDPDAAGGSNECQNEMQLRDDDENAAQDSERHSMRLLPKAEEASSIISIILKTLKLHGFQTCSTSTCNKQSAGTIASIILSETSSSCKPFFSITHLHISIYAVN